MNRFELLQVESEQATRDSAESFMNEFVERFADRKNDEHGTDIDDNGCGLGDAQTLLQRVP